MEKTRQDFVDWLAQFPPALRLNGQKIVYYFPFAFIGLIISLKIVSKPLYWAALAVEDGPAESMTSVFYLLASAIAVGITLREYKQKSFDTTTRTTATLAVIFFLIAMEEISWGQRIFAVQSPDFFVENNQQGELNLHNFLSRYPLHLLYILVGLHGAFAWKYFPHSLKTKFPRVCRILIPDRILFWYFFPTVLIYLYYDYISVFLVKVLGWTSFDFKLGSEAWLIARDQEPIELLLSIGILCFTAMLYNRQTHQKL